MRFVSYSTDGGLLSEAAAAAVQKLRALATSPTNLDEVRHNARL
jgi:hypothetical protein